MSAGRPSTHHLRTFYLLTVTQVLSIIGSIMTHTAVGIRVFSDTGTSTPLLMASFFSAAPPMVGGLFAGALADRWNRRRVLIGSDAVQAVGTLLLLAGLLVDRVLEPAVGGPWWAAVAPLVGSRPGSGMGLLIAVAGALIFVVTALVYAWPRARGIERDLPDYAAVADAG